MMVPQPRLKLALIGLGRLGAIRARIIVHQQPRIELVAACDTKPGASEWATANLPPSVQFYADPEDCLRNSGAEAVLISTATATHAPLICLALDLDLVSPLCWLSGELEIPDSRSYLARNVREAYLYRHHYDGRSRGQGRLETASQIPGSFQSTM